MNHTKHIVKDKKQGTCMKASLVWISMENKCSYSEYINKSIM